MVLAFLHPKQSGGGEGRLTWRNLERTMPELPWERVTLPQMMRTLEPLIARWAV